MQEFCVGVRLRRAGKGVEEDPDRSRDYSDDRGRLLGLSGHGKVQTDVAEEQAQKVSITRTSRDPLPSPGRTDSEDF